MKPDHQRAHMALPRCVYNYSCIKCWRLSLLLLQVSHARLKGDLPLDREWNTLSALASEYHAGGKGAQCMPANMVG